jgi:hypothetical protein
MGPEETGRRGMTVDDIWRDHRPWGRHNVPMMAGLSVAVVATFALVMLALSVKISTRTAVQ